MKKLAILVFGVVAYLGFQAVILYAIAFIGNIGITNSLDALPSVPMAQAVMINLGLLSLFAVQHSGMARTGFKNWVKKFIPESAVRSLYVLMSNIALFMVLFFWEPIGGVIWHTDSQMAKITLMSLYMFGWALVFTSSFLINHFNLFGLQQVWYNFKGKTMPEAEFRTPSLYRFVRHPLYVGFIIVVWATPTMTVAHLMFAILCTAYILVGIQFEENDLKKELGPAYEAYQQEVPMIVPSIVPKVGSNPNSTASQKS